MGGTFLFARYAVQELDPLAVAFLRFTLAGIILIAITRWRTRGAHAIRIAPADRKRIWLLGAIIILGNQTLYLYGQAFTSAVHGALLFTLTPVFAYLLAIRHLDEKWSILRGVGILLAVAGSVVILLERGLRFDWAALKGDVIIFLAVAAWAYYLVSGKPLVEKYGAIRVSAYTLASGALIYFPFGLYRLLTADLTHLNTLGWLSILYITIVTSVIGYSIWYWLLKFTEASKLSVLSNTQPVVAGVLGFYLLGEAVSAPFVLGALIILGGVTITQKA